MQCKMHMYAMLWNKKIHIISVKYIIHFFSIKTYENSIQGSLDLKFEPSLKVNRKGLD